MGIRDSESKNNWKYASTNNQTISWTNWSPGLPDNYNGKPENCVDTLFKNSFKWNDSPCEASRLSICETTTKKKGT